MNEQTPTMVLDYQRPLWSEQLNLRVGFRALSLAPGLTVVMHSGRGVQLNLIGGTQVMAGSEQPQRMLEKIEQAMAKDGGRE